MKINPRSINLVLLIAAAGLFFWFGRLSLQYQLNSQLPPVQIVEEINQGIPQVIIESIQDAKIIGSVNRPEIRLVSGDVVAVPNDDLSFELDIQHLGYIGPKREVITKAVPEGAKFVASKSGKYYYDIDERSLKQLSVENQVYYFTKEEAEAAGKTYRTR